jgi:hypothetical protein
MSGILNFVPEILDEILSYAGPVGICRFWCTTPLVWPLLASPSGLSAFEVDILSVDPMWLLPKLLTSLQGLKKLKIQLKPKILLSRYFSDILPKLPSSLQSIDFEFVSALEVWKYSTESQKNAETENFFSFPFDQLFPSLHTLKLSPLGKASISPATVASIWEATSSVSSQQKLHLPASLTHLDIPKSYLCQPEALSQLPNSLDILYLTGTGHLSQSDFHSLQNSSISTLHANFKRDHPVEPLNPGLVNMTAYELVKPHGEWFSVLSPLLIKLSLPYSQLEPESLKALPTGLQTFSVLEIQWKRPDEVLNLPRSLTSLTIFETGAFPQNGFQNLPSGLLELQLDYLLQPLSKMAFEKLPSKIRKLQVSRCAVDVLSGLTPNIESFKLSLDAPHRMQALTLPATLQEVDFYVSRSLERYHRRLPSWLPCGQYQRPETPGWTDVVWAASQGHVEALQLLVGPNRHIARLRDVIAVAAVQHGHLNVLEWLELHCGVYWPRYQEAGNKVWFLGSAAMHGHAHILKWLQKRKHSLLSMNADSTTLAHFAAKGGHLDILKWLKEEGVDLRHKNIYSCTVVHDAAQSGQLEVLKWLDTEGLDLLEHDATEPHVVFPIFLSTQFRHYNCTNWLVSKGASLTRPGNSGTTLTQQAVLRGHLDIVVWLFEQKAFSLEDIPGLLDMSISSGHTSVSDWLRSLTPAAPTT